MNRILLVCVALVAVGLFQGCSKANVAKALKENPELVFDIIRENPEKFIEAASEASQKARQFAQKKRAEQEAKSREEEFKNPKKPEIAKNRAVRGDRNAPLTIVEYSDFQCPYCNRGYKTVEEVRKKYGKKVRFIYKHLPLPSHPLARPAAEWFEAIAMQSPTKAYKFHDILFENQGKMRGPGGSKYLETVAKKVGANIAKAKKDMKSDAVRKIIEADMAEASKYGISGTPGFVVAGVTIKGAYPASEFEKILERRIKERGIANN